MEENAIEITQQEPQLEEIEETPQNIIESVNSTENEQPIQQESEQQMEQPTQQEIVQESTQQENSEEQTTEEQTTEEQTTEEQTTEEEETDTNNYLTLTDLEMFSNPVNFYSLEPTTEVTSDMSEYEKTVIEKLDSTQSLFVNILAVNIVIAFAVFFSLGVALSRVVFDRLRG